MPLSPKATRRLALLASSSLLLFIYLFHTSHSLTSPSTYTPKLHDGKKSPECAPGLENIVVVLKTGVTEATTKLPIHRTTTLHCIPHSLIWSDYEEEIAGLPVHNVLANTSDSLHSLPDFELYTRVQTHGRAALTATDTSHDASTPFGKPNNPGWKLDKWKFLPMLTETYARFPGKAWYVFMEADTYIVWPALMEWLGAFDSGKPYYLGNQMQIRDVLFAHGGSGFVLSQEAMRRAVKMYAGNRGHWDSVTADNWAGDCVLGMLLRDAGVPLGWAWPMLQLAPVKELNHFDARYGKVAWCHPPVSFHHVQPDEIEELWGVDRRWRDRGQTLVYRDVFFEMARPKMDRTLDDWDNLAGNEKRSVALTKDECEKVCEKEKKCLQWTFEPLDRICSTSSEAKLGEKKAGVTSGWRLERIDARAEQLGRCKKTSWIH